MIDPPQSRDENFRDLVYRTYRLVLWHFRQKSVPEDEAEDLAQDTFLAAFRGLESFRGEVLTERWLLTIAENRRRNWIRHGRAGKRVGWEVSIDSRSDVRSLAALRELVDDGGPAQAALDAEEIEFVRRAVEDLPSQMRHCATLRLFQGLSYKEVAATLRISVDAVKVQLFRAKRRIRARIRQFHDGAARRAR